MWYPWCLLCHKALTLPHNSKKVQHFQMKHMFLSNSTHVYTKSQNSGFNTYSIMALLRFRRKQSSVGVPLWRSCLKTQLWKEHNSFILNSIYFIVFFPPQNSGNARAQEGKKKLRLRDDLCKYYRSTFSIYQWSLILKYFHLTLFLCMTNLQQTTLKTSRQKYEKSL